jgi:hypothetical protein
MTKIALRILIAICLIALGYFFHAFYSHEAVVAFVSKNAPYIFVVAGGVAIGLIIVLVGAFLIIRHVLKKRLDVAITDDASVIVQKFADQVTNREGIESPNAQERMNSLIVSAGLFWLRREMLYATLRNVLLFIASVGGLLTVVLLYEQNQRIQLQTHADISAALLTEGARRAALAQDLSRLFGELDKEIAEAKQENGEPIECDKERPRACWIIYFEKERRDIGVLARRVKFFVMSETLFYKFSLATNRHQPYYLISPKSITFVQGLDFESPIKKQFDYLYLSPERGQILSYLARNHVQIPWSASFENSDLRHLNLRSVDLTNLNLNRSNMQGIRLEESILETIKLVDANLVDANLRGAVLLGADLGGATLTGADLREARLEGTNMRKTVLTGADFRGANLFKADLSHISFESLAPSDILREKNAIARAISKAKNLEGIKLPDGWEVEGDGTAQSPYRIKVDGVYVDEELPDSNPHQ